MTSDDEALRRSRRRLENAGLARPGRRHSRSAGAGAACASPAICRCYEGKSFWLHNPYYAARGRGECQQVRVDRRLLMRTLRDRSVAKAAARACATSAIQPTSARSSSASCLRQCTATVADARRPRVVRRARAQRRPWQSGRRLHRPDEGLREPQLVLHRNAPDPGLRDGSRLRCRRPGRWSTAERGRRGLPHASASDPLSTPPIAWQRASSRRTGR